MPTRHAALLLTLATLCACGADGSDGPQGAAQADAGVADVAVNDTAAADRDTASVDAPGDTSEDAPNDATASDALSDALPDATASDATSDAPLPDALADAPQDTSSDTRAADVTPDAFDDDVTLGPLRTLSEGFHVAPTPPEDPDSFSMIVASDPQLWWNFIDGAQQIDGADIPDAIIEEQNRLHIRAMNALIAGEGLPGEAPAPIGVIMNGDLTEYGRWAQWDAYYRLYEEVNAPIYDGMGNHEYENNNVHVSNGCGFDEATFFGWQAACEGGSMQTLWGESACEVLDNMIDPRRGISAWCASDAMRRMRHWLRTHAEHLVAYDEGSGAYAWEIGDVHFVQLHNDGLYESPEATICGALPWLKADLKDAFERDKKIVLLMHKPIPGALREHLVGFEYNIVAIFYGHYHRDVGYTGTYRVNGVHIPMFFSGSVEWNAFTLAHFEADRLTVTVIDSNSGAPVHHPSAADYEGGIRCDETPYAAAYPTHACPAGQVPEGVDGPCVTPTFDTPTIERCY